VFPAYAAVEVIAGGIEQAKSEDPAKVAEAIHKGTFKTPTGNLKFDAKGDVEELQVRRLRMALRQAENRSQPSVRVACPDLTTKPTAQRWVLFYRTCGWTGNGAALS
jgi:hypothetical protein